MPWVFSAVFLPLCPIRPPGTVWKPNCHAWGWLCPVLCPISVHRGPSIRVYPQSSFPCLWIWHSADLLLIQHNLEWTETLVISKAAVGSHWREQWESCWLQDSSINLRLWKLKDFTYIIFPLTSKNPGFLPWIYGVKHFKHFLSCRPFPSEYSQG